MTPNELLYEAQKLSPSQQIHLIIQLFRYWLISKISNSKSIEKRVPNLHPDVCVFGDDFDDPLPDSFWLGEE
jgi:hypothetical protein